MRHTSAWILGGSLVVGAAFLTLSATADNPEKGVVQQESKAKVIHVRDLKPQKVIGWLGRPLGEIVVIEGIVADGSYTRTKKDSGATLLRVDTVNGYKLRKERIFHFGQTGFTELTKPKAGTRFRYTGYETGGFRGLPAGTFKYVPPVATPGFHFATSFVILRDENAPKKRRQNLPPGNSAREKGVQNPPANVEPPNSPSPASKREPAPPEWKELQALLGKSIGSKSVLAFAERHRLKRYTKFTSGGFDNSELPIRLLFEDLRISHVNVVVGRNPKKLDPNGPIYRQKLPHGVKPTDTPEAVIRRLGRPSHQPSRNEVVYTDLGLRFYFDRDTHKMRLISMYAPKKSPAKSPSK